MAEVQVLQSPPVNPPPTSVTTMYSKTDGLMYSNSLTAGERVMTSIGISIDTSLNIAAFRA